MVVIGVILYIHDRLTNKPSENSAQEAEPQQQEECSDDCCTTHDVCPSEMLLKHMNQPVVYYEDEELDSFAGRRSDSYTDEEAEQFEEVLTTLRPEEVAAWNRSLILRGINVPDQIKDELLMLLEQ